MTDLTHAYARQLENCRSAKRDSDERLMTWIGDNPSAEVWWDGLNKCWWIADRKKPTFASADEIALVRCNGDPAEKLLQRLFACDLDGSGTWLVDTYYLDDCEPGYLDVIWRSDSE